MQLHAVLTESLNQQFEDYAEFVFSPDAHAWSFAFNLDGRGDDGPIKLNDMNCRQLALPNAYRRLGHGCRKSARKTRYRRRLG